MIGKARKYKWLDFTDSVQCTSQQSNWYSYIIQDVVRNIPLRTETYERANFHWWYSSETLAWSRLFTFTWKIIGRTKTLRHTALSLLMNQLKPELSATTYFRWFYDLEWKTDNWENRVCSTKVYSMLTPTNWLDSPVIDYTFDLYSETEKIYEPTTQLVSGSKWVIGWTTLPTPLPTYLTWYINYITVTNNGDWYAPIKVQVVWTATNPQIINLTNNNKYTITGTTSNFILDNRNLLNIPTENLIVTDNWVDIKAQRSAGADIFLDPGINYIIVLTDNPTDNPLVYITYRHTYIF